MQKMALKDLSDHLKIVQRQVDEGAADVIADISDIIIKAFQNDQKVIIFGNGGSAADAQHIAAEFVGRFQMERKALPAIALSTNTSNLTCLSNDYGFEIIFERQIEAIGRAGDVAIGLSTSGSSGNVIKAIEKAKSISMKTVAFIGQKKSPLESVCDIVYKVPSDNTARIQESHILAGHIVCHLVELALFKDE